MFLMHNHNAAVEWHAHRALPGANDGATHERTSRWHRPAV
jgi:hypothetical protein